jgi:hypothetical protein
MYINRDFYVVSCTSHQSGGRSNEKEGNKIYSFSFSENSEGKATRDSPWDSPFVCTSWLLLSPVGEKFLLKVVFFLADCPNIMPGLFLEPPKIKRSKIVSKYNNNNNNNNTYNLSAYNFGHIGKMILSS